jgi:SAM-dependent methyltransferase
VTITCYMNDRCLACDGNDVVQVLDLGSHPLANSYLTHRDDKEETFPLRLNRCVGCDHLQLSHTVDPKIIYSNYTYVAGTSTTLREYSDWFSQFTTERSHRKSNTVLDIGCNDGTQLDCFAKLGWQTTGFDPAGNIISTTARKHRVVHGFFPQDADKLDHAQFDIISAQNVVAHNPSPYDFLSKCRDIMQDHTVLYVQTSQADMIKNGEFDTIYHEHVNFFNTYSMKLLCQRADMELVDVKKVPIHGCSYIFVIRKGTIQQHNLDAILKDEKFLHDSETYVRYSQDINDNLSFLKDTLVNHRMCGYSLVGYGAAAKGNTLLNYAGLDLDLIIDDSPIKQGRFTPGRRIPIVSRDGLAGVNNAKIAWIPLAWNFHDEIVAKIKSVRDTSNDVFIKYFPKVQVQNV